MSSDQATEPNKVSRSKLYFIIGWILLLVMALVWSLNDSFIYLSLGGSSYFFFLSFWYRASRSTNTASTGNYGQPVSNITDIFKIIFSKKKTSSSSSTRTSPTRATGGLKVGVIIFFCLFFSFFSIVFLGIISTDDNISIDTTFNYERANEFANAGEYDSAEFYYWQALRFKEDYAEAYAGVGYVYLMKENYDSALVNFDRCIAINPSYDYALYCKSLVYYYQKNYKQSLQESFKTLEANPSYTSALLLAGDNYSMLNQSDSALYWYEKGYDSGVRTMELCNAMASVYDTQGKTDKAISLYKEALTYDSTNVSIYTRLGQLLPADEGTWYRTKAVELTTEGY